MSAPKLCNGCKHYVANEMGSGHDRCTAHPSEELSTGRILVRGESMRRLRYCDMERMEGWIESRLTGHCGADGRWWEEK